jgi:hypothetical protein
VLAALLWRTEPKFFSARIIQRGEIEEIHDVAGRDEATVRASSPAPSKSMRV